VPRRLAGAVCLYLAAVAFVFLFYFATHCETQSFVPVAVCAFAATLLVIVGGFLLDTKVRSPAEWWIRLFLIGVLGGTGLFLLLLLVAVLAAVAWCL
jgi:hypothetical protein